MWRLQSICVNEGTGFEFLNIKFWFQNIRQQMFIKLNNKIINLLQITMKTLLMTKKTLKMLL
jgi:hypothetical protein